MAPRYPAIEEPTVDPASLRQAVLSLKQAVEILTAQRGDPLDAAVTLRTQIDPADLSEWRTYTPVITPQFGAITTYTATGRYKLVGKTVFLNISVTITTAGTGSGVLFISLPEAVAAKSVSIGVGRETAVNGKMISLTIGTSGNPFALYYDNSTMIVSGTVNVINAAFERA